MTSLRVLITGGTGLLGRSLLETLPPGTEVLATFHRNAPPPEWKGRFRQMDVRDESQVERLLAEFRPDWTLHTASIGSVDEAQQQAERVREVNLTGTRRIGEACSRHGSRLVLISSNAVFDGKNPPYREEDPVCPLNRYGEIKAEAERWVCRFLPESLIFRPILMYGWPFPGGRENAVTRWLALMERGEEVAVSKEITTMPLLASDCALAAWAAIRKGKRGIYHVAGEDRVSLEQFCREVASVFGFSPGLVKGLPGSAFRSLAPRPTDTSFQTEKLQRELGIRPVGIREGLARLHQTRPVGV